MADQAPSDFSPEKISLRLVVDEDHVAVRELFHAGLIEGYVADNDTGADIFCSALTRNNL